MDTTKKVAKTSKIVVSAKDLPLHCPTKEVALWCSHPRVFLEFSDSGEAHCPYCGTRYSLKKGEKVAAH